jgi:predicted alternative tryptophan synthase beta-subunit
MEPSRDISRSVTLNKHNGDVMVADLAIMMTKKVLGYPYITPAIKPDGIAYERVDPIMSILYEFSNRQEDGNISTWYMLES